MNKGRNDDDVHVVEVAPSSLLTLACQVASAFVSNNQTPVNEIAGIIGRIHKELVELESGSGDGNFDGEPAVAIKKSITDDFIICLEDGKKLRTLKRYLRTQYDMSPDDYRKKWRLPPTYPMVAPSYTAMRSQFAKKIGLGKVMRDPPKKPKK